MKPLQSLIAFCALLLSGPGLAQPGAVEPRLLVDGLDGPPTEVAVLATLHLRSLETLEPAWTEPLLERLQAWQPDLILIENLPAYQLEAMRADPAFAEVADQFGGRSIAGADMAQTALRLTRREAEAELSTLLYRNDLTIAEHRRTAALLLASYDPVSALIHWQAIPAAERVAADGLSPELVGLLEELATSRNETVVLAARLAGRLGHTQVHPFDSHLDKDAFLQDAGAISSAFSQSQFMADLQASGAIASLGTIGSGIDGPESLLDTYRLLNSANQQAEDIRIQWASFARADMSGLGRTRLAYWDSRNLMMASNARRIMARYPGRRVLVIVGASHKPFLDDLLGRSMDVEIVDVERLID